ncbi:MAG: hypothetical protein GXO20_06180 [Thermodesulfobacteria bacterium]|nr:hypothetical protein [Thermodesulfobacteriota bacterium]
MRFEKILWWLFIILFVIGSVLIFFHLLALGALAALYPEVAAFLIGFLGFWLFANRLIFGYGGLANSAAAYAKGHEPSKEELLARSRQTVSKLEDWTITSLLALWQAGLEPFKYAYYLAFFLVFLGAMLFELNFFEGPLAAWAAKGLMLGAAIPTLLVFALDLLANAYLKEAFLREI